MSQKKNGLWRVCLRQQWDGYRGLRRTRSRLTDAQWCQEGLPSKLPLREEPCSGGRVSPVCPKISFRRLNILHYNFCPLVHFPFNISACSSETELVHSNGIKSHYYPRTFWSDLESLQEHRVGLKSGRGSQGLRWLQTRIHFRNNPRWLTNCCAEPSILSVCDRGRTSRYWKDLDLLL